MTSGEEAILNFEEAADYLRIKRRTLYTLAAQRKIPAVKIGGQWRFQKKAPRALFETGQAAFPPGEPAKSIAEGAHADPGLPKVVERTRETKDAAEEG